MSKVEDLIAELRSEATEIGTGQFTLDAERARLELDEFKYLDREAYLSPVVEGLVACGARALDVTMDGADVRIEARRCTVSDPAVRLREIYAAPFHDAKDDHGFGFGRIAIGLDMALGHSGIARAVIEWGAGERTWVGHLERGQPPRVFELGRASDLVRLTFDRGWAHELAAAITYSVRPELVHLRNAIGPANYGLVIGGIRAGPVANKLVHAVRSDAADHSLASGFDITGTAGRWRNDGGQGAFVLFLSRGIIIESAPFTKSGAPDDFVALVELRRPQRDASQFQLVHGKRLEHVIQAVDASLEAALQNRTRSLR